MQKTICRWGILGTANIARKNWQAIRNAPNCTLDGRGQPRSRPLPAVHRRMPATRPLRSAAARLGSYEELLASDAVDAVYIPLPTGIRKPWAIRAAEAGKHVLVEKPVGATSQDVREILAACRQNGVQFMDGVMFMHSRRMESMREILADGQSIGPLKRITSQFTFGAASEFFASNIRTHGQLEPLGCLGDLGWYNIRFTLWAMNWELPARVAGHILAEHRRPDSPAAVPTDFSAELFFAGGVSAGFYCSFLAEIQQWANLAGTKGFLYVPDFVLPWHGAEVGFRSVESRPHHHGLRFQHGGTSAAFRGPRRQQQHGKLAGDEHVPPLRRIGALGPTGPFLGRDGAEDPASPRCLPPVGSLGRTASSTCVASQDGNQRPHRMTPIRKPRRNGSVGQCRILTNTTSGTLPPRRASDGDMKKPAPNPTRALLFDDLESN